MKLAPLFAALALAAGPAAQAMPPQVAPAQAVPTPQKQAATTLSGEVLEVRDVDSYTYLRIKAKEGDTWAAVPRAPVKKGARVTVGYSMVMTNFESKSLKKTFDRVVFGTLVEPGAGAGTSAGATAAAPAMPAAHGAAPAATTVAKIAKATGPEARTVAEIVTGKAALKGKPVLVHAQVVKVTPGILGKNWVHLQDGSGKAADGTHDVIVTTQDSVSVGDVVNARGTVRTDVNVGSGYAYAVLVEDAKLRK